MLDSLVAAAGHSWGLAGVSCLACGVLSAIFPWIAAEAVLVAFLALARSPAQSIEVVCLLTAGQMAGKALVFWSARRGRSPCRERSALAERWRSRIASTPRRSLSVVLASSLLGFPPFFLVTFAAGAWGVDFRQFLIAGAAGRFIRFAAIAWLPYAIAGVGR